MAIWSAEQLEETPRGRGRHWNEDEDIGSVIDGYEFCGDGSRRMLGLLNEVAMPGDSSLPGEGMEGSALAEVHKWRVQLWERVQIWPMSVGWGWLAMAIVALTFLKIAPTSAHKAPSICMTVILPHLIQKRVHQFGEGKNRKCHLYGWTLENDVFGCDSVMATTGIITIEKQRFWTVMGIWPTISSSVCGRSWSARGAVCCNLNSMWQWIGDVSQNNRESTVC